jgi:hypothetical protein
LSNIAKEPLSFQQTSRAKRATAWIYGALIIVLSAWVLHSFFEALLAACVTAIASWPLYRRFAAALPSRMPRSVASLIFTCVITLFVLAPLVFAFGALLTEANEILVEIAAADKQGFAVPRWLENVPLVGSWAAARWETELAHPGAVSLWAQRTDPTAFLGWAHSFGVRAQRRVQQCGYQDWLCRSEDHRCCCMKEIQHRSSPRRNRDREQRSAASVARRRAAPSPQHPPG